MGVDEIRADRERREAAANAIAATLPPGDYYAADNDVCEHETRKVVATCASHWDACLVMMAVARAAEAEEPDAYGRTGEQSDCFVCHGSGVEYDETCVQCGGYGWVRS